MIINADPATTHALVVGVETYGNFPGTTLDGPVRNACDFANWLSSRGVPPGNIHLHLAPAPSNEHIQTTPHIERRGATDAEITAALRQLRRVEGSLLFVYWSGHAFELNSRVRMLVADADPMDTTNVDLDSLLHALRTRDFGRIAHHAVLVDTCRLPVDPAQKPRFRDGCVPSGSSKVPYWQLVLLSAQPNQPAANAEGTGIFSKRLLALLDVAPEAPWPPDLEEIAQRLHHTNAEAGLPPPALWRFRGWHDNREEIEILALDQPRARVTPPLTRDSRKELLGLLGRYPEMSTPEGLEQVLGRLHRAPEVRSLTADLSGQDQTIEALVDVCSQWPDGIMDLIGAVRSCYPGSEWEDALVLAFPAGILTYAQLDALWPLILQVDLWGDHLQQLYQLSLPHGTMSYAAARTTAAVVRVLADMTPQQGSFPYPVLEFVERVATYTGDNAHRAKLVRWVDQVGSDLKLDAAVIDEMRSRVNQLPAARSGNAHLQLAFRRSAYAPDTLWVNAWYRHDAMAAVPVTEREVTGAGAPEQCLSMLLRELALDERYSCRNLGLEFFLEHDMLCHPVDEWLIQPVGRIRIPVGISYSCVLRSLERAESKIYWDDWSKKWRALLTRFDLAAEEALMLICRNEGLDPGALFARFKGNGIVGVCLSFAPPDPADADETILDAILEAGLPLAIWLKYEPGDGIETEAPLRQFLSASTVADLRATVQEHRNGARQGDAACTFGSRVALLWDDPTRPLPTNRLRQPTS